MNRSLAAILAVLVGLASQAAPRLYTATLQVHAAASLSDALTEIATLYERETGTVIRFNFGGSSMLERQIVEGAPGDIFLSADEAKMDLLADEGLIVSSTRTPLLSNALVVIVPRDEPVGPAGTAVLLRAKRIAIAEPESVPAGIYARKYLERAGLWEKLRGRMVPTDNVRGALAAVEAGNVDAAIVYRTDALISKQVRVAAELTDRNAVPISYPVAVLSHSAHLAEARRFLNYLRGAEARAVFVKYGFVVR